ncbi:MAG: hypothetical protein ACRDKE_11300 [Solirubrobacterales bacterium]
MSDEEVMETPIFTRLKQFSGLDDGDVLPVARNALDAVWARLHPEWVPSTPKAPEPRPLLDFRRLMLQTIMDYIKAHRSYILDGFEVPSDFPAGKQVHAEVLFDSVLSDLRNESGGNLQESWEDEPAEIGIQTRPGY